MDKKVKIIRYDNGIEFKNKAEAVSTACYVQNMVLVVKPHNKTPYELFRGFKPTLSFMRPFGCHVTILNTLDSLGKFDGKSDEGFFVGYSLSSKAFRAYNTRTRKVEENLHIGFLENKPMIEGNGPKWLFDIDSLTQSMNYVPVAAGTIINESAGTQGKFNAVTSEDINQDCIVMSIWKDTSYFDSPTKDVDIGEPKSGANDQKQVKKGLDNEKDKSDDDSSPKEVNVVGKHVNTASSTLEATHVEFFSDEDEPEVDLGEHHKFLYTIRLFLAYASFMGFLVYQMDVKSAFLNGTIEEEVYVTQLLGFKDPDHPDKVYKVVKVLYGLHQAPRAWLMLMTLSLAPPGRTAKLRNDILMFQQHHGEYLSKAWTHFKDLLQKVPHHGIDLLLQVQFFYDHVNPVTRRTIDQSADGKLRDLNPEESWAILEDLAFYDNKSWNDPRDFAKPVKAITLP
ncbi:retrovirus-related pol polyprotein from transposon TNT 1-94 [Tanacetum coccineum]